MPLNTLTTPHNLVKTPLGLQGNDLTNSYMFSVALISAEHAPFPGRKSYFGAREWRGLVILEGSAPEHVFQQA